MCQSYPVNDELMRAMVYEGVNGVSDKYVSDQCTWYQRFKMRLSISNKCDNIDLSNNSIRISRTS